MTEQTATPQVIAEDMPQAEMKKILETSSAILSHLQGQVGNREKVCQEILTHNVSLIEEIESLQLKQEEGNIERIAFCILELNRNLQAVTTQFRSSTEQDKVEK